MLAKSTPSPGRKIGSSASLSALPLASTSMDSAVYAHYETGNYVRSDVYLDDKEYGKALDTIVKGLLPKACILQDHIVGHSMQTDILPHFVPSHTYIVIAEVCLYAGCVDVVLTDDGLGKVSPESPCYQAFARL